MPEIDLYLLPKHAPAECLADATVIVVDLLRASTTIITALAAGAECVMPFGEVEETLTASHRFGRDSVLLGGERHGKRIPGFDLGNSPLEYTPTVVAGRRILFTTTNGARALHHARKAQRVLVGAVVNRTAIARTACSAPRVAILCAGTDGEIAPEDVIAGGAIIDAMTAQTAAWSLSEDAAHARDILWRPIVAAAASSDRTIADCLALALESTQGARNLLDIGNDADLPACSQLDKLTIIPEINRATGEIRPA